MDFYGIPKLKYLNESYMEMFNDVMNILKPLRLRRPTSDYKIMKHISSGGHGSVYVGRHKETGKMVAIKELELPFGTKNVMSVFLWPL